ncbi:MAG: TlpA family protein disulfide reductase [Ruminococcaceae bacterium]|nr:TlpA family protein disulfide reductase [Oscillospiraceae bacterium]
MKKFLLLILALSLLLLSCSQEDNEPFIPDQESDTPSAYDFKMQDVNKSTVRLSNLMDKPVVLNFWASWCPPCKSEMPSFEGAYIKYGEDVNFVMLSVDSSFSDATKLVSENEYTFPIYHDSYNEGSYYYNVTSIPRTYFITTDGAIVLSYTKAISKLDLEEGIENLKAAQAELDEKKAQEEEENQQESTSQSENTKNRD